MALFPETYNFTFADFRSANLARAKDALERRLAGTWQYPIGDGWSRDEWLMMLTAELGGAFRLVMKVRRLSEEPDSENDLARGDLAIERGHLADALCQSAILLDAMLAAEDEPLLSGERTGISPIPAVLQSFRLTDIITRANFSLPHIRILNSLSDIARLEINEVDGHLGKCATSILAAINQLCVEHSIDLSIGLIKTFNQLSDEYDTPRLPVEA